MTDDAVPVQHPAEPPAQDAASEVRDGLELGVAQCRERRVCEVQVDELQKIACAHCEMRATGRGEIADRPALRGRELSVGLDVPDGGAVQDRLVRGGGDGRQAQWGREALAEHVVEGLAP